MAASMTTTVDQSGRFELIVDWVNQAWLEIQNAHDDWDWMRSSNVLGSGASFVTVAGTAVYPLGTGSGTSGVTVATFGKWDNQTFRCYTTSVGTNDEQILSYVPFDWWRNAYMIGANRDVETRPVVAAVATSKAVCLGPPPTALFTVTADYFLAPTLMEEDDDTPTGLPAQYHTLIMYKAMQSYAGFMAAPEVMQRGMMGFDRMYSELQMRRLPQMMVGGALA